MRRHVRTGQKVCKRNNRQGDDDAEDNEADSSSGACLTVVAAETVEHNPPFHTGYGTAATRR